MSPGRDHESNMQTKKRKRMDADVAGPPQEKILHRGNISHSTDASSNIDSGVSVSKRRAEDDGGMPAKRRKCRNLTSPTDHTEVSVARLRSGKRRAVHDGDTPNKRGRQSVLSVEDPLVEIARISEPSNTESGITEPSISESSAPESSITVSSVVVQDEVSSDDDDVCHNFGSVSAEEEKIFEMSSSANTSRADFEKKYRQLAVIGAGGFGSVYAGYRRPDFMEVAIKYVPIDDVKFERVMCNGKAFHVVLEVALMLKAAGPGSVGQSATVSLLDWYILDRELILVMERPAQSQDLYRYLKAHRGSLDEHEAKMILRQLVDAAINLHSKGVFHRDIKPQNILVQLDSNVPRVRVIDFGCGSFASEKSFTSFSGTRIYAPPEWFKYQTYWAGLTTVWQLGALFYQLLSGHEQFNTMSFVHHHIRINRALSTGVKTLLYMSLAIDPMERATLEDVELLLSQLSPPLHPQNHL